ncbi:PQQ-like beta-propeller repeat protein [Jidongwangia harbinensis]|uniref:PQQ-like beta-propeller repeat protein n=1 Tax=Jidongwangia harbinensis TaxID=2878561 RepID=UPI001CD923FF|nr:PQQ-like beta-propeller repeat protein [Jidongwangia harbinensis]MCA2216108.1 PQQ-like beta-propeller repeat protein [Jidongwangia harbinensis]
MSHGVIDLGDVSADRHPLSGGTGRRRPAPYRPLLGVLAVVLAGLTGGAVHRGPPAPPTVIGAQLRDAMMVTDDRVFVVGDGQTVSAYALPDGRLLHRFQVDLPGTIFVVSETGPALLVSGQVDAGGAEATVAVAPGTDLVLWRRPARLLRVSRPAGLALLREQRPAGGADWHGVDVATGAVRWTAREPDRGFITLAGPTGEFPRLLVSVTESGSTEVRDAVTGVVVTRATVRMPHRQTDGGLPFWPLDDLLLVGDGGGTTAYTLPGLVRLWRSPEDLSTHWVQADCPGLCLLGWQGGLRVLDPATGALRWSHQRWTYVSQVGAYLVAGDEAGPQSQRRLYVVDPRTGRVHGDLGRWQMLGNPRADGTVLGIRPQSPGDEVRYALLDPAAGTIRLLGLAAPVTGDCQATPHALVCRRIDASIGIWRLG